MRLTWQAPRSMKAMAIFLVLMLHGLFSSPAPSNPGLAEAVIALCLMIAMLPEVPSFLDGPALLEQPEKIAWLWLLLIPLGIGLAAGHVLRDLSRDLIAVGFLGLPILIGELPERHIRRIAAIIALTGSLLALRYWMITGADLHNLQRLKNGDGLLYLCLDSTLLFAAVYLPITLMETKGWLSLRAWAIRILCLAGAFLCWGTIAGMQMRGALGLAVVMISTYALLEVRYHPIIPAIMAAIALAILALFWDELAKIGARLWEKHQQVGFNARDDDFAVIWHLVSTDPLVFLFGSGWGAIYSSPAVGGYWVNYSHSALGYFLFKTGAIGVLAVGFYVLSQLRGLPQKWQQNRTILLAIVPPLLLSFTIYTSYKFLSCGILLLLLKNLNAHSHPEPG